MNVVNLAGNPTADPVESTYIYKDKDGNEKNGRRASFVLAVSVSFCQKVVEEKENTEFVEMSENAQNEFFSVPEPGENDLPMPY